MKNNTMRFSVLFFLIISFYGCSTQNNTTTVVPNAPTNLTAMVMSTTQVNLTWTDNATNESGYKIQRKTGSGTYADVGSTGVDIAIFSDLGLTPNTTYMYRVYSYNNAGNSLQYSNEVTVMTDSNLVNTLPTVNTSGVVSITSTTAVSGGNVTADGGSTVTARGVCWSTSINPTISLSTKTMDGTGTGSFTSSITSLDANTTYYVRAYATNSAGTSYGAQLSFTTVNGTVANLPSVTIGTQIWSSKNLDVAKYRNGDPIPQVSDATQWQNLTTGAWCWYNNDSATYGAIYGRLYNWYAVNDPRGLAPQGWHVPSDVEWNRLTRFIDPNADTTQCCSNVAGTAMKSTSGWFNNGDGTNSTGFTGLPGGFRDFGGTFLLVEYFGYWWSASEYGLSDAWYSDLTYESGNITRNFTKKAFGFSVRVVRD